MMKYLDDHPDITIFCILIGLAFSCIFGLSSPALYLTDEWITVNQLHQLNNGSQLLNTEGKYGRLFTGETSLYFTTRGNYLAYSLFLPVLSLPALNLIIMSGDLFRLGAMMIWGVVTLMSLLLVVNLLTKRGRDKTARIVSLLIVVFMLFFFGNLILYTPFSASYNDSPIESAAVVLTNEGLLALMAGVLFLFYQNVLQDRRAAIGAALITLFCSSYLFWSSTAKDHMLMVFLISCTLLLCSELVKKQTAWKGFLFFIMLGLIAWARPEVGFFILGAGILWFLIFTYHAKPDMETIGTGDRSFKKIIPLSGILVGLVPFFINNALITGNPFIPTQILYLQERGFAESQNITPVIQGSVFSGTMQHQVSIIDKILSFFTPNFSSWAQDIFGIFFYPSTGAAGLFFVCPVIIIALFSLILWFRNDFQRIKPMERQVLLYSSLLCIIIFLTHLRGLHGLNSSLGIYPDIRYLSPLYLCMSVISILILTKAELISGKILLRTLLLSAAILPLFLIIGMIFFEPFGGLLLGHYQFLWVLGYILVITSCIIIILPLTGKTKRTFFSVLVALLAIIPLTWQIMLISLYAVVKMNGYPYWLPIAEYIMSTFLMSVR